MEYFIGSLVTVIAILILYRPLKNFKTDSDKRKLKVSQSRYFEMLVPYMGRFLLPNTSYEPPERQSTNYEKSLNIKLVIHNNKAYWLHENKFYTATVVDGVVDKATTKPVDTMGMSTVELKELSQIVDALQEGTGNDSSNSGNQKF
jgi:hypothetical protein